MSESESFVPSFLDELPDKPPRRPFFRNRDKDKTKEIRIAEQITPDHIRAVARKPYEVKIVDRDGGLMALTDFSSVSCPPSKKGEEKKISFHNHPGGSPFSVSDIMGFFREKPDLVLVGDEEKITEIVSPTKNPLTGESTGREARDVLAAFLDDKDLTLYDANIVTYIKGKPMRCFGDLSLPEQHGLMREFLDKSGMIKQVVMLDDESGLAEIASRINEAVKK
jgi:hypothetical protein